LKNAPNSSSGASELTERGQTECKKLDHLGAIWSGKSVADRMPFFAKVNLREVYTNLGLRWFSVSIKQFGIGRTLISRSGELERVRGLGAKGGPYRNNGSFSGA
jgi:hypothetical protein